MWRRFLPAALLAAWCVGPAYGQVPQPETYGDAMRWYDSAAEAGLPQAQFFLGRMYELGEQRPKDLAEAARWYRRAAEGGYALAQYKLGEFLFRGTALPQDKAAAAKWFQHAADQGVIEAQYDLALLYDSGDGVAQDRPRAAGLYRRAALAGLVPAQRNLGILLTEGDGIPQDLVEGWAWLALAAEAKDAAASSARDMVGLALDPAKRRAAQKRLEALRSEADPAIAGP